MSSSQRHSVLEKTLPQREEPRLFDVMASAFSCFIILFALFPFIGFLHRLSGRQPTLRMIGKKQVSSVSGGRHLSFLFSPQKDRSDQHEQDEQCGLGIF